MKKLLIIGYVWPEPNSSAAGSRMMQLIDCFHAQQYNITFASPAQQTEHMIDLTAHNIAVENIKLNCDSFNDFIGELQPDAVMFDRFMMEEQFGWRVSKHSPNALRILDTEDLFCLRNGRHDAFKKKRELTDSDLLTSELAQREIAAIFRSDISLMISHIEIALLQRLFNVPANLLHYCPFMLTKSQLNQENPSYQQRDNFMVIGNFRHPPNWDAVLWLKQQIWPLIRKQLPKAQLHVYGAYPPPKATDLHNEKTGFLVKGWVDDALIAMQNAKVCLAPLRFGAGIKGKLAEAMMCATPSVTTDIGAESMQPIETSLLWPGSITNEPQAFADAAVKLFENESAWQVASELGPKNANQIFDKNIIEANLAHCINNLTATLTEHRQRNFVGSMLNHHHHKSTQYMSQWIDVKTQLKAVIDNVDTL